MTETRRRGDNLETTIYNVALNILERDGYDKTTFAQIAREAKTSRSVLYRRWDTVFELVHDAITQQNMQHNWDTVVIDTWSLRGDLIAIGEFFQSHGSHMNDEFIHAAATEFSLGSPTARRIMMQAYRSDLALVNGLVSHAIQRDELQHTPSERVRLLLFEILRYHGILIHELVSQDVVAIVDEIILPAFFAGGRDVK
ncbi:TetR/AcrR family transcriptional regulator [Leuconostoc gelidum subsp. gasicomitatum]|uniref:TetR/AcrR family transcriptional regulator n=1 Tax=Leuconostoc gasicomitatum TaxID=115778 RepID=UPI001CC5F1C4|nr:TetR/AcrR family transcriptional regulator [Leuconostoc gasicomitatum]MBZ5952432.1 TetR/AcrR family transcriptional regulator [Leuconostoc gasicomitatum]